MVYALVECLWSWRHHVCFRNRTKANDPDRKKFCVCLSWGGRPLKNRPPSRKCYHGSSQSGIHLQAKPKGQCWKMSIYHGCPNLWIISVISRRAWILRLSCSHHWHMVTISHLGIWMTRLRLFLSFDVILHSLNSNIAGKFYNKFRMCGWPQYVFALYRLYLSGRNQASWEPCNIFHAVLLAPLLPRILDSPIAPTYAWSHSCASLDFWIPYRACIQKFM